jgi:uncharacterized membrane protein
MRDPRQELEALKAQIASLTARVYRLEQKSGLSSEAEPVRTPAPPGPALQAPFVSPSSPEALGQRPLSPGPSKVSAASKTSDANLERKIGQYWLNRVGIIAILIGTAYFLKYAFENNWVGEAGRIASGLAAGIALVIWSERFRNRGYAGFSYSLKALGIGILYLSLWAAFQLYHLMPAAVAFGAMVLVTAATIILALTQETELLAAFALIGGLSTPVLVSSGENHEVVLLSYVCLLDLAILVIAASRPWRRLLWVSFVGTVILYIGWYAQYYSPEQRGTTILFASLFAMVFAAIPLVTLHGGSTRVPGRSITLTLLPPLNAAALFLAMYAMHQRERATLGWYALILATVYLGISSMFARHFPEQDTRLLALLHVAIAVGFITVAIPLKLHTPWATIGWLVESAALFWIGARTQTYLLRYLAIATLGLGIFRLLFFDRFPTETLVFNARFATYLVAILILGGIAYFGVQRASKREMLFIKAAIIVLNLLALIALTGEASGYFNHQLNLSYTQYGVEGSRHGPLWIARDFSYSAIWLTYGTALMAIGFRQRSAFVRWQALVLIAFTIGKVFLYDVSRLARGYRILSFIALGAVLLGISFIYQRDWLRLSSRSSQHSN